MDNIPVLSSIHSYSEVNRAEKNHSFTKPFYKLNINYNWEKQELECKVEVKTDSSFISKSALHFLLPANGLKSRRTLFASINKLEKENFTKFRFKKISINGESAEVEYPQLVNGFESDSTLLKIHLSKKKSLEQVVSFVYSMKVPRGDFIFGVSEKNDFSVLRGFYPILLSPQNKIINLTRCEMEDFPPAEYSVTIRIPDKIKILNPEFSRDSSGRFSSAITVGGETVLFFSGKKEEIIEDSVKLKNLNVKIFSERNNKKFLYRIKKAVQNSVQYLSGELNLPIEGNLLIVDLPRSLRLKKIYSSGIAAFHIELFSPVWTKHPEADVIKGIIHQLSVGDFTDFARSPWLLNGIGEYLTDEIYERYYGKLSQSFKLVSYLPIKGETMFAYNEIPIIYRLDSFAYEPWKDNLSGYLSAENKTDFMNVDYTILSEKDFKYASEIKPSLVLQALKNFYGEERLNSVLSWFYKSSRKSGMMDKVSFNAAVKNNLGDKGYSIWKTLAHSSGNIDYSIAGLNKLYGNKYLLRLSKKGEINLPQKISVYTKKDTLNFYWNGKKRIKEIVFSSADKVIGAEIDPQNRNILDVNRANNSYLIDGNYSTAFAYAIHWFFWVQNALMMFGVFG